MEDEKNEDVGGEDPRTEEQKELALLRAKQARSQYSSNNRNI